MDGQVQDLLNEERQVNKMVKDALQKKRDRLATIQAHTDQAVAQQRRDLQEELAQKIAEVSIERLIDIWGLMQRVHVSRHEVVLVMAN